MSIAIPTLVEQLTSYLAYEEHEAYEEPQETYHAFRAARLRKQLAAALKAEAAGIPLPPVKNAWGIAPIWDEYGIAIPGSGNTGANPGTGIPGPTEGAPRNG